MRLPDLQPLLDTDAASLTGRAVVSAVGHGVRSCGAGPDVGGFLSPGPVPKTRSVGRAAGCSDGGGKLLAPAGGLLTKPAQATTDADALHPALFGLLSSPDSFGVAFWSAFVLQCAGSRNVFDDAARSQGRCQTCAHSTRLTRCSAGSVHRTLPWPRSYHQARQSKRDRPVKVNSSCSVLRFRPGCIPNGPVALCEAGQSRSFVPG